MELKGTNDLYTAAPFFYDPVQSGGHREWEYGIKAMKLAEWNENGVLQGIRDIYAPRFESLLHPEIEAVNPPPKDTRLAILRMRQMVVTDCMDCMAAVESIVRTATAGRTHEDEEETYIPVVTDMEGIHTSDVQFLEGLTYGNPIPGARLQRLVQQVEDEEKLRKTFGAPRELRLRIARHPSKSILVDGHMFTKESTFLSPRTHTYKTAQQPFAIERSIVRVGTIGVTTESLRTALPQLLADTLEYMRTSQKDRLEDGIEEYHNQP